MNNNVSWRLSFKGNAIVVSSGMLYLDKKKPGGLIISDVHKLFKSYPYKGAYHVVVRRRVTLKEGIEMNRIDMIGKEVDYVTSIDFYKMEYDRKFEFRPFKGYDILNNKIDSEPLKVRE